MTETSLSGLSSGLDGRPPFGMAAGSLTRETGLQSPTRLSAVCNRRPHDYGVLDPGLSVAPRVYVAILL